MKTSWLLGACAVALTTSTSVAIAKDPVQTVISLVVKDGKTIVQFDNAGQLGGVMPGDKGWFLKDGAKVGGADYELSVFKINDRTSWATVSASRTALQAATSMQVRAPGSRKCTTKGKMPDFGSAAVAQGKKAPPGFVIVDVHNKVASSEHKVAFTIWKGTDDGVMPTSKVYALVPDNGVPLPYKVDITWASGNEAGGYVTVLESSAAVVKTITRLGVEIASCKSK
jgi:hypothetical protein